MSFEILPAIVLDTQDEFKITKSDELKQNIENAASLIAKVASDRLANEIYSMDTKEIKDLAKLVLDIQRAFFGSNDITINNIQNNISQTKLNYFKSSLKDEI